MQGEEEFIIMHKTSSNVKLSFEFLPQAQLLSL